MAYPPPRLRQREERVTADFKLVLTAGRYQAAAVTVLNGKKKKTKGAISEGTTAGLPGQSLTVFMVETLLLSMLWFSSVFVLPVTCLCRFLAAVSIQD